MLHSMNCECTEHTVAMLYYMMRKYFF